VGDGGAAGRGRRDVPVAPRASGPGHRDDTRLDDGRVRARAFALVGLDFDAQTFVAIRVLESSVAEDLDLEHALSSSVIRGLIDRSAALSEDLLAT
jgi:hypothetical protein